MVDPLDAKHFDGFADALGAAGLTGVGSHPEAMLAGQGEGPGEAGRNSPALVAMEVDADHPKAAISGPDSELDSKHRRFDRQRAHKGEDEVDADTEAILGAAPLVLERLRVLPECFLLVGVPDAAIDADLRVDHVLGREVLEAFAGDTGILIGTSGKARGELCHVAGKVGEGVVRFLPARRERAIRTEALDREAGHRPRPNRPFEMNVELDLGQGGHPGAGLSNFTDWFDGEAPLPFECALVAAWNSIGVCIRNRIATYTD